MRHTLWYNILRSLPNDHVKFSNRRFWRQGEPIAENHSFSAFIRKSFVPIKWKNASRSTWNDSKRLNLMPSYILKWHFRCSNSLKLRVTKSTKSSVKQRERWNRTMPIPPCPSSKWRLLLPCVHQFFKLSLSARGLLDSLEGKNSTQEGSVVQFWV